MTTAPNIKKGNRYKFAWEQIDKATKEGFYLEVITICESMITDRLISFAMGDQRINTEIRDHISFCQLLSKLRKILPPIEFSCCSNDEELSTLNLLEEVDKWREGRNAMLHGLAKSEPGKHSESIDVYRSEAQFVAERGRELARLVIRWHEAELARFRNAGES